MPGLFGTTRIHRRDATDLGVRPGADGPAFDLAFLDPPYGKGLGEHDATAGMGQSAGHGGVQKSLSERMFPNMPN